MMDANLEDLVLTKGAHTTREEGVCAMEAVAWLAGEPHSDHPACACPALSAFMHSYNDTASNDEERQKLKAYLPRMIGSNLGPKVAEKRSMLCVDWLIREYTPAWLELAGLKSEAAGLRSLDPILTNEALAAAAGAIATAKTSIAAAWEAAGESAGAAAWEPACAAARAAAGVAAWATAGVAPGIAAVAATLAAAVGYRRGSAAAGVGEVLAPTAAKLRASALNLLDRMLEIVGATPA